MASRFATVTEEQILAVNEAAVPENTKKATKFGLAVFTGMVLLFLAVKLSPKPTQNDLFTIAKLRKSYCFEVAKLTQCQQWNSIKYLTEWFQMQEEFTTPFEEMSAEQLNKCLQKFYLSARKRDGSFYNKNWVPYRNSGRFGPPLEKSSVVQTVFYCWRQPV